MNEFLKTLVSTLLGFTAGYLSYLLQYTRNKKVESISKVKLSIRFLDDFVKDIEASHSGFMNVINDFNEHCYVLPTLKLDSHPAVALLPSIVQSEEYQNAFLRTIGKAVNSEDFFYKLRTYTWKAQSMIEEISKSYNLIQTCTSANTEKISGFFRKLKKKTEEYAINATADATIKDQMKSIVDTAYSTSKKNYFELTEIKEKLTTPIHALLKNASKLDDTLLEIRDCIWEIDFCLAENNVHHEVLKDDVAEMQKSLSDSLAELHRVLNFFNDIQVQSLYM